MRTNDEIVTIIEERVKEMGISMSELARRVDMAKSALSRYFNRTREFPINRVNEFARVLGLTPEYILGFEEKEDIIYIYNQLEPPRKKYVYDVAEQQLEEQNNVVKFPDGKKIIRGRQTAAGSALYSDDYGVHSEVLSASMVPSGADELVEVVGKSMEPLIKDGEDVYIRHQPQIENGEIAIVRIEGDGVTCKRFYVDGDTVTLKSENPEYEDMHFDPSQITVLGKVLL